MIRLYALILGQIGYFYKQRYYSQNGEDVIMRNWLPEQTGFYVDIGAGKPIAHSNTFMFYRQGWNGICVDPINSNKKLHKLFRSKDKFIEGCVKKHFGETNFWEFKSYLYSTTDETKSKQIINKKISPLIKKYQIKCFPLSNIVPKMTPSDPSFLSIDVEGADFEVLKSNNWELFSPRLICVEELNIKANRSTAIQKYLQRHDYLRVSRTSKSSIFVHTDYLNKLY